MTEPSELTATEARAAIARGDLSAETLVWACLERIDAREAAVQAWVVVDRDGALAAARALDRGPSRGVLHGVPIGFKDIIDTAALPTSYGSPIYAAHQPAGDAACVSLTRTAGAVMLGKTVTTEFAFRNPNKTRNPHNPAHTPGGSSSGSAAAVADGMVPLAFGTQTAGSIIRPASFCGVVGYKPTIGRVSYAGLKLLARSLDTLGGMARSVDDLALLRAALLGASDTVAELPRAPRIGFSRTPWWDEAEEATRSTLVDAARTLRDGGAEVVEVDLGERFRPVGDANETIMGYEACRALAFEIECHEGKLSPMLREVLGPAEGITFAQYQAALAATATALARFEDAIEPYDALLVPSAPGEAPATLKTTGNALFNRPWTTIGVPCVTLPASLGPHGLPVGLQLVGRLDDDERLLAVAKWTESRLR